jgi:hypothetical protein
MADSRESVAPGTPDADGKLKTPPNPTTEIPTLKRTTDVTGNESNTERTHCGKINMPILESPAAGLSNKESARV